MTTEITTNPEKTTLKQRIIARAKTAKQFVGQHKACLAIGAVVTPLTIYLARKAGAADQLLNDQAALDEYFETIPLEVTETTESVES